jgi:hypothetical protein
VSAILYRTNILIGATWASTFARVKAAYTPLDNASAKDAAATTQAADVAFDRLGEL